MSASAKAIHGYKMSGDRRANLEIKSECPALLFSNLIWDRLHVQIFEAVYLFRLLFFEDFSFHTEEPAMHFYVDEDI